MKTKLTTEQTARLAPYEKYFGMAIRSGYSTALPTTGVETLRAVWLEHTGKKYPLTPGCSVCYFNLIHDMGQLYYAATGKDPFDVPRIVKKSPVSASSPSVGTPAPAKAKSASDSKKKGKKAAKK